MNPFLDPTSPPAWDAMTPDLIEDAIETGLATAKSALENLKNQSLDELTYESTFAALDASTEDLYRAWGRVNHLDSVNNSDALREQLNKMLPIVSEFGSSIPLDTQLWSVLKAYSESAEAKTLAPIYQRNIEETCDGFINSGANLEADKKEEFSKIQSELNLKTQKFSENVLDSTNSWELVLEDRSRLKGLPDSAIEAAKADALAKGFGSEEEPQYRFTLQHTSLFPVMQYGEDESLRKELWEASKCIGASGEFDNSELIREIIALRTRKAQLLGFESFADWALNRRMAKSGAQALSFVGDLHDKIKGAFDEESVSLQAYKAQKTSQESTPLAPWELSYWAEKRRKEEFDFDEEELRPYFPLDKVMNGMFSLAEQLFDIQITTDETHQGWHPEVTFYRLVDKVSGELLGEFYADWHPRETKRGGAWMNCLETGLPPMNGQNRLPHLGLICGNMTKPIGDTPALMNHNEVTTIFHEFGHLIHQLLSEVAVKGLAGTNVAWDFVELPSQIMENFCWDMKALQHFSGHYETGEPIPQELFDKLTKARNYMSATGFMRQLAFGKLDLELHHNTALDLSKSCETLEEELISAYKVPLKVESKSMLRRFSHLFSSPTGYAAGYYSYKWAEVLDADAFTAFRDAGVVDKETGLRFRETVLSKGNSEPPQDLFRAFMGREPSQEALLKRANLL